MDADKRRCFECYFRICVHLWFPLQYEFFDRRRSAESALLTVRFLQKSNIFREKQWGNDHAEAQSHRGNKGASSVTLRLCVRFSWVAGRTRAEFYSVEVLHSRFQNYFGGLMLVFQWFPYFARGGFAKFDGPDLAKLLGFCIAAGSQTTAFVGRNKSWRCKTLGLLPRKMCFGHLAKVQKTASALLG